ncbi:MAG TPA: lamin tail domain-containing protein, partial [Kofleriaceae bacterium]|nr:lamin tail domain-containing protein [Kofleriaceae bacterium]
MIGRAFVVSTALLLGAGCGPSGDDDDLPACAANLLAGDLVITEVFADAVGEDEGKEWFEIYNATNQTLDLAGVVLTASKSNGEDAATHVMTQQIIDPGQYLVLGGVAPEFRPSYVDYGYGPDLRVGSSRGLPNSDGKLELKCDVVIVDEMTWSSSSSGKSRALDGSRAPDYNINDDQMLWCDSVTEFELGSFGTPKGPNDACSNITPTMCNDNGTPRALVSPELGDVVITEYMARPSSPPGAANGEWLELLVTRDVDLNGLQLGQAEPDTGPKNVSMALASADCLRFTAGSYVLLA